MCVVPRGSFIDSLGNIATLTYDYLMDSIEVTQLSFKTVMNGFNPSNNIDDKKPVENVTWYQAIMYCNALSKMLNLDTAYRFNSISAQNAFNLQPNLNVKAVRLPTEDEWEMAAHAGKNLLFATDDGLLSCGQANYGLCNVNSTKYAGSYPANPYGIHDMTGNVLEWCWDVFNDQRFSRVDYANSAAGGFAGSMRVQRGGDYQETNTGRLQNNSRRGANPTNTNSRIGFRCVIPLKQ
jgi:formylglycine-generating enzyme required for sulfatase activity